MITMSFVIAMGLLAMLVKLPWKYKLWMLGHPVLIDVVVFVGLLIIHGGSFEGAMVAGISAFFCSLVMSATKWLIGCNVKGSYQPGRFDISERARRAA